MLQADFSMQLLPVVKEYITLSGSLCETLIELKKALLSFDNAKLNRVLDEKLVLNEQILSVNARLESLVVSEYGEFTNVAAKQILIAYPQISDTWGVLRTMMKSLKSHALEVRRIIRAIEKYHMDMKISVEGVKPRPYKQYAVKGY